MRYQIERILNDRALAAEIAEFPAMAVVGERPVRKPPARPKPERTGRPTASKRSLRRAVATAAEVEAIVLAAGRPSLPIRSDSFEVPQADTWKARLYPTKSKIDAGIRSVGRIEVPQLAPYEGTGWVIAPGILVTNRHVALRFATRLGDGKFDFGTTGLATSLSVQIDFREEEYVSRPFEVRVSEVLYIAEDNQPDVAFLRVKVPEGDDRALPPPIPLFDGAPEPRQLIAVIGYPSRDPDASPDLRSRIFGTRFEIKRLAPGEVMEDFDGTCSRTTPRRLEEARGPWYWISQLVPRLVFTMLATRALRTGPLARERSSGRCSARYAVRRSRRSHPWLRRRRSRSASPGQASWRIAAGTTPTFSGAGTSAFHCPPCQEASATGPREEGGETDEPAPTSSRTTTSQLSWTAPGEWLGTPLSTSMVSKPVA